MSEYLLKRGERGSQKLITRWRCGKEEERNEFWKTKEEKKYRICGVEVGCLKHIMSHTRIKIRLGEVLDERGKGYIVKWMREVNKWRDI